MAPRKILVIDDSPFVLEVTRATLEHAGFTVVTVMTVDAFEEQRRSAPPDLIIVDIQMPEIFGDDLAQTIRGAYREKAPIIFLSGLSEEELAMRAKEAGADGWVTKRAGPEALVAKVREVLS